MRHSKPKSLRKNALSRWWSRLFCARSILIISEHKTDHVPVSIRRQLLVIATVLGFVSWASYSTGNYMSAQETLREKEQQIANSNLKNRQVESEFALLKRDLVSLMDKENPDDLGEYAQFVIEQYRENGESLEDLDVDISQLTDSKHGAMFERIAFLEQKVDALKNDHDTVMDAIRDTAQGRINQLEQIIAKTGLEIDELEKRAARAVEQGNQHAAKADEDNPQGGPYDPVSEDILRAYDEDFYDDLKRLVVLDSLVDYLPLAEPMKRYKLTSGYGIRMDPFRKKPARHEGLDFAGPAGSKIYSANDGKVTFVGRRGAYGLLVEVDHGLGITTRYGHLKQILVKEGQHVNEGQVLGIQGSTGRSTGAHLHYEVRYKGATLNPAKFLKAGEYVRTLEETND